jgi:Dienelactone hydrolase family
MPTGRSAATSPPRRCGSGATRPTRSRPTWPTHRSPAPSPAASPDERLAGDVDGAVRHLRSLPSASGKVGVIGYCSGGRQPVLPPARPVRGRGHSPVPGRDGPARQDLRVPHLPRRRSRLLRRRPRAQRRLRPSPGRRHRTLGMDARGCPVANGSGSSSRLASEASFEELAGWPCSSRQVWSLEGKPRSGGARAASVGRPRTSARVTSCEPSPSESPERCRRRLGAAGTARR